MAGYFGNSEYDYTYLETSDYESLAQSTSYSNVQQSKVYPQELENSLYTSWTQESTPSVHQSIAKAEDVEYNLYDYNTSWIQDSALSIADHLIVPEAETIFHSAQSFGYSDIPAKRSLAMSWPMEYFSTLSGVEFMSEHFSPPSPVESSHSSSSAGSTDDSCDVFDVQFRDALNCSSAVLDPEHSFRQSHYAYLETLSDFPESTRPSRPRRSPTRTPSPSNSETGSRSSDDRRRFPCLLAGCSRRFTSQYTLKVHMEAHKPKPKVSFPCTEGCSERFSRQHDRLRHEVSKHGKVCEFSCEECGRFFSTSKTLGNHKCPLAQGGTRWVHS